MKKMMMMMMMMMMMTNGQRILTKDHVAGGGLFTAREI